MTKTILLVFETELTFCGV